MSSPGSTLSGASATLAQWAGGIDVTRFYDGDGLKEEAYTLLGNLARAADVLLEGQGTEPSSEPFALDFMRMARGLRSMAYLLLAEANPEQAWFWTEEWQAKEREADVNKLEGRVTHFDSDEGFIAALKARRPDVAYP